MSHLARLLALAAAFALLVLAGCGGEDDATESTTAGGTAAAAAADEPKDTVKVQLDYQIRGNHGMFFVAEEQGFFAEEGIEVEDIRIGTGSADAMRIVGDGQADFGFGDLPTLVTARSQGVPVVALAAVNQLTPLGMCAKNDKHQLNSPEDLKGLTFGAHTAGSTYIFYKALLAANGIDRSEITERTVTPPYENFLLQDRVDFVPCYIDAEVPELEAHAGGPGSLSILPGAENGYDVYGSGLFTNQELVDGDPDLVQRFVNAYLKAFAYVVEHPAETAQLLAESSPELEDKKDVFQAQLQADIDHTFTSESTEEHGLGAMDREKWENTITTLADQKVIETSPEVDTVYSEEFVSNAQG